MYNRWKSIYLKNMIAAIEGETIANRVLEPVDVSAIAGWSEPELKNQYKKDESICRIFYA